MVHAHPTQPPDKGLEEIRDSQTRVSGGPWRLLGWRGGGEGEEGLHSQGPCLLSPPPKLTSPRTTRSFSVVHADLPGKLPLGERFLLLQCV